MEIGATQNSSEMHLARIVDFVVLWVCAQCPHFMSKVHSLTHIIICAAVVWHMHQDSECDSLRASATSQGVLFGFQGCCVTSQSCCATSQGCSVMSQDYCKTC